MRKNVCKVFALLLPLVLLVSCKAPLSGFPISNGYFNLTPHNFIRQINLVLQETSYDLLPVEETEILEQNGKKTYKYEINNDFVLYLEVNDEATKISNIEMYIPYVHPLFEDDVSQAMFYIGVITGASNHRLNNSAFDKAINTNPIVDSLSKYTQDGIKYTWFCSDLTITYDIAPE